MSNKIYPALNERIAEALTDGFNFSEGLLKELSAIINRAIEDYSKAGLPFTKALAELEQSEPGEFTKLARSCIPPREVFDNIPITEISERPGTLESVVHTACDIIDRLTLENEKSKRFEDYSYYVGGEITCGRVPMKYSKWLDEGCPA